MKSCWTALPLVLFLAACGGPANDGEGGQERADEPVAPAVDPSPVDDAQIAGEDASDEDVADSLPGNEIWLVDIGTDEMDAPVITSSPRNLTNRPGYDNQPWFAGEEILFTRGYETGQTDIWAIHLETGETRQVTDTPEESEYSPQIAPDGRLSYIHQPPDGYGGSVYLANPDNSDRGPAFEGGPFGYYLLNESMDRAVTFALTDPLMLTFVDFRTDTPLRTELATSPGRALWRSPSGRVDAYVTLSAEGDLGTAIHEFDFTTAELSMLGMLPDGAQDFAVGVSSIPDADLIPVDRIFAFDGGQLVYTEVVGRPGRAELDWRPVEGGDFSQSGLTGVTRLVLSPDGSQLAIVSEEWA